ncbi:hypothetical protein Cgig2_026201 [Carnegiea gigantea]|uniref:Small auxin up regulated protein n=1 Tax=Carnegiea gigantea TaxID=171969 RepID=A0A9Q1GNC3_9CARY|nr:hypothetical protein Cgig2_026201 [Carnegiea gigantea]
MEIQTPGSFIVAQILDFSRAGFPTFKIIKKFRFDEVGTAFVRFYFSLMGNPSSTTTREVENVTIAMWPAFTSSQGQKLLEPPSDAETKTVFLDTKSSGPNGSSPTKKIPVGFFAVYVGEERQRFIVPMRFLSHPLFKILLEKAQDEFGFEQKSGLLIPCSVSTFQEVVNAVESNHGSHRYFLARLTLVGGGEALDQILWRLGPKDK